MTERISDRDITAIHAAVAVVDTDVPAYRETRRRVPRAAWGGVVLMTLLLTAAGVTAWELAMRRLGLTTADIDDTDDHWAAERRALAEGAGDQIAIVGDSRIWFDTDVAVWEAMTGHRPVQLALQGTSARHYLRDLARDERFSGLVVAGITEMVFLAQVPGVRDGALGRWRTQSLAQRFGHQVYLQLSRWLAFLDQQYTPQKLFRWMDLPSRQGVINPAMLPWKISESFPRRQTFLWPRVLQDTALRDQTRTSWMGFVSFGMPMPTDEYIQQLIEEAADDVRRIRARGGEVVFVRPPSGGDLLEAERRRLPRARGWDRLLEATGAFGVHWEDHPDMQDLDVPEWSHLSRESASRYTRAYVRVLAERVPWLRSRLRADVLPMTGASGGGEGRLPGSSRLAAVTPR